MSTPTARQQTIRINRLSKENDQLSKELEHVKEQLRWSRITSSQETELKNSCFFFIAAKGLFTEWHEWHDKRITERLMDEINWFSQLCLSTFLPTILFALLNIFNQVISPI